MCAVSECCPRRRESVLTSHLEEFAMKKIGMERNSRQKIRYEPDDGVRLDEECAVATKR